MCKCRAESSHIEPPTPIVSMCRQRQSAQLQQGCMQQCHHCAVNRIVACSLAVFLPLYHRRKYSLQPASRRHQKFGLHRYLTLYAPGRQAAVRSCAKRPHIQHSFSFPAARRTALQRHATAHHGRRATNASGVVLAVEGQPLHVPVVNAPLQVRHLWPVQRLQSQAPGPTVTSTTLARADSQTCATIPLAHTRRARVGHLVTGEACGGPRPGCRRP